MSLIIIGKKHQIRTVIAKSDFFKYLSTIRNQFSCKIFSLQLIPSGSNVYRKFSGYEARPQRGRTFFKILFENISVIFQELSQLCRKSLAPIVAQILEWEFAFLQQRQARATERSSLTANCCGKLPLKIVEKSGIKLQKISILLFDIYVY